MPASASGLWRLRYASGARDVSAKAAGTECSASN
jgi:hypothetical protein